MLSADPTMTPRLQSSHVRLQPASCPRILKTAAAASRPNASDARQAVTACLRCGRSVGQALVSKAETRTLRASATQTPRHEAVEAAEEGSRLREGPGGNEPEHSLGVRAALGMLSWYKGVISPLLPPACRYLPTCSSYAMDAYTQFGVGKGTVLTAWRLLRCSPFGSSGYDPVRWPPPGLEWVFRE